MVLQCPFCHAPEDERIEGVDELGNRVVLLMFDCPFHFKLPSDLQGSDESIQAYLDNWRRDNGDEWLESVGPVMKSRELGNIERSKSKPRSTSD
jgi:hypothetical protein